MSIIAHTLQVLGQVDIDSLPSPSFSAPVDLTKAAVDDTINGALFSEILDADVKPTLWRLDWNSIMRSTGEVIREHYRYHATGQSGEREWLFTPTGGTEVPVSWFGAPRFVSISNAFVNVTGLVEVNRITGALQPDRSGGIVDGSGNILIKGSGGGITFTMRSGRRNRPVGTAPVGAG